MGLLLTRREEFAVLTLDRPEALNALNTELLGELDDLLGQVAAGDARALLVTGAGERAFCAGADVKELGGRTAVEQKLSSELGQRVFARLEGLPIPAVAIVNGYAFGGGLELALACTFRLATPRATFAFPEIKLGLIPGYGGTQRLPRVVGQARALDMVLTGRTVTAAEAAAMGLVHRVVEGDPLTEGTTFARQFSAYSLPVLALAREAVTGAFTTTLEEGLRREAALSTVAFQTADAAEGIDAFIHKRKPRFRDR